jgi:uncharacterized protein involved in outer membrane biogenesis
MPKSLKIAIWTGSGVVGVLAFLAVAGLFFIDANDFKPQLEVAASRATGMKVQVKGAVSVGFFPRLHIALEDVQVRNRGIEVGSARQAKLGIGLFSLLGKKVRVRTISLKNAKLYIERDQHGVFNFENAEIPKGTPRTLDLVRLSVLDATVSYVDKQSGNGFSAKDCTLEASRLKLTGVASVDLMKNIHITANMICARVSSKKFVVSDLNLSAQGENGIFHLKPVSMQVFSGQGSGQVAADFSDQVPRWQVQYRLSKFRVEEFLEPQKPMRNLKGPMDFFTSLSMQGKTLKAMQQTAGGEATLMGENLTLVGRDLDRELALYDSTQNFNLVDAGALFFAGPIGVAITKGYDFANLLRGKRGSTKIRTLVSEWRIEHGVAEAQDVAIATNENRLALHGGLDFANQRYQHVTVALVDAKGCTLVRQKILGSFRKPVVEQPNIIGAITGPAINLLTMTKEMFTDRHCELFYRGSVLPPEEMGQGKPGKAVE